MAYDIEIYDDVNAWKNNTIVFLDINHAAGAHLASDKFYIRIANNIITENHSIDKIDGNKYTLTFDAKKVTAMPVGGPFTGTITIGSGGACDANVYFAVTEEAPPFLPKPGPKPEPETKPNK